MKKRGFTLIEMLIVIVIIGILAGALIPRIGNARDKANDVAREANVKSIATAVSQAMMDNATLSTLCPGGTSDIGYSSLSNYGITASLDGQPTTSDKYRCIELASQHFIVVSEIMSAEGAAKNCFTDTVLGYDNTTTFSTATQAISNTGDAYCMVQ